MKTNTIKKYKPTSPGRRHLALVDKSTLFKGNPEKSLCVHLPKHSGRNNAGRITSRGRGGGHKIKYRIIDFRRIKDNMPAVVERIEYDPNRSAFIALIRYDDGVLSYIIAPQDLQIGDIIISGLSIDMKPGNATTLENIVLGSYIHCVEMQPGRGAKIARSAGGFAQLITKEGGMATIRLLSGETRLVPVNCRATIGIVSNGDHMNVRLSKAGQNRVRGRRPLIRGVATNPVDHRNGGRTSGGRIFSNEKGTVIKGKKTGTRTIGKKYIIRGRSR